MRNAYKVSVGYFEWKRPFKSLAIDLMIILNGREGRSV
jgi:hypothetical protein